MIKKISPIVLIALFLFTRFYNISQSLFFYNDMGRDLLVLLKWQRFGDIPLLGPQTSALPVNQSPIYYYLLAPFYFLSGKSPYSALFLNAFFYLGAYTICLFLTRSQKKLNRVVHLVFLLMIFHPQFILQNRYVWNPSLLPPIILVSLILFLLSKKNYVYFSIVLVNLAVAIHYSAIPLLISYLVFIFFAKRNLFIKSFAVTLTSFSLFNLTTIVQLIKRLITTGAFFHPNQIFQTGNSFSQKLSDFIGNGLGLPQDIVGYIFLLAVIVVAFFKSRSSFLIFLLTFLMTIFSPFNLQAHYIFVITTILFLCISLLNWKLSVPLVIFLLFFYLQPNNFQSYLRPSPRTYQQMDGCFKKFCQEFKEPIFVSAQSNLYPYHFGPEHRYLMLKNNCQMKEIEKEQNSANYMAVVLDNGSYSDKIKYYELDLFGKHKVVKNFSCQKNFGIVVLKKS